MSRAVTGEQIVIQPSSNIFTALAAIGMLAQIIGIAAIVAAAMRDNLWPLW